LRDSEEQYRAIFNASADALVLRGDDYRAVEVNPAYTTMSGFTREEVMAADRVLTQADAALRTRHRADHDLALAGTELRFEATATRKDGTTLHAEVRGTPVSYRGRPHVLYAVRDITARVAAEQRRAELERQLRQAQKMEAIGQLTGGLAHDFNNILTSVLGYIGMAQERPAAADDPVLARQLAQARLAADRAREHVAQLLSFSRPHQGERRLLSPPRIAAEVLQLLRPNLPSSISVDGLAAIDAQPPLPPVLADPVQFEQVLLNLCINARDAIAEHGTIRLRLGHSGAIGHCASCSAWLDGGLWVWFEVADDGRGMGPEVLDRMFEPFFTTKDVGRGTGMGLAMVHGIVHDHGGHVLVDTAPGQGACFSVLLPPTTPQDPFAVTRAGTLGAGQLPNAKLLLVEDDIAVGNYLHEQLTNWGLQVTLVRDPAEAVHLLADAERDVRLLMTDLTMPGMTGLQLAEQSQLLRPHIPVLLVTGNGAEVPEAEARASGVSRVLKKPLDALMLKRTLHALLS
jgi:PAS domain S-box-containing protein